MASIPGPAVRTRADDQEPDSSSSEPRAPMTAGALFLVLILFWVVTRIETIIFLILFSVLLGTILEGPVRKIEARHVPRPAAISMIYAFIIGMLVLLVFMIIPVISDQVDEFRDQMPEQIAALETEWRDSSNPLLSGTGATLMERAREFLEGPNGEVTVSTDAVQSLLPVVVNITAGIVGAVSALVITFYYLMERAFIRKAVISQVSPHRQQRYDSIWQDVEDKVGGWIRGQLVLCLVIGVLATIAYAILDLRFWPLLGLWAGITEIIPIIGPWLGGIPAVIVALTHGWQTALIVATVIVVMQSLENWILVPRIMRGAVGLSPLTVFLAILAGTQFMGIIGAVLAIPIAASVQVVISHNLAERQLRRETSHQPSGWRWMLARAGARDDGTPPVVVQEFPVGEDGQRLSEDFVPQASEQAPAGPSPAVPSNQSAVPTPRTDRDASGRRRSWPPSPAADTDNDSETGRGEPPTGDRL